jgi:hypothetical protein
MKKMTRFRMTQTALAVALAVVAGSAEAQQTTAAAKATLDSGAMSALQGMGAYLRTLKTFQVEAATTNEDVLEDGQKTQYDGTVNILATMPGRLRADVSNERNERMYLYDGKSFTLFAKRLNYYATVPAPATIWQLANKLDDDYGIGIPLADLFRWGTPGWSTEHITGATDLGPSAVQGTTCQHYAFRQDEIDWQIWIQKGDNPLPRKLVITTKTDEARPQSTAVYNWNLAPSFNDAAFTFDPPAGAGKVVLAEIKAAAAATK